MAAVHGCGPVDEMLLAVMLEAIAAYIILSFAVTSWRASVR